MTRPNEMISETWLAPGLRVEGTIAGSGHVRIAAQFKGTIDVTGEGEVPVGCGAGSCHPSRVDLKETGTVTVSWAGRNPVVERKR
jgi:cytoskeletal protein CcmA (bactofilin family)